MKKNLAFLFLPIVVLLALVSAGYFWWAENSKPVTVETKLINFVVAKGSSAGVVGTNLQRQGLIKNSLAFKFYVQLNGLSNQIKPGEYQLSPSLSLVELVNKLTKGPDEVWVTIPEGLRREEVAQKFAYVLGASDKPGFLAEFLKASQGEEGYLFPDTYLFAKDASAAVIINKMKSTFDKKVDAKLRADINSSGKSLQDIVILASLIERETRSNEEKPVVAGILYKRMELGMPLQVDATIQYALANSNLKSLSQISRLPKLGTGGQANLKNWWPEVLLDDRKIKSPYNTYLNVGLPPDPIANPGLSSIQAAIYPIDSPYLYYLHDKDGIIHYAKTLDEHNQNIRKYIGS